MSEDCPLPCTYITAQSAYQLKGSGFHYNAFEMFVENDVAVEKVSNNEKEDKLSIGAKWLTNTKKT